MCPYIPCDTHFSTTLYCKNTKKTLRIGTCSVVLNGTVPQPHYLRWCGSNGNKIAPYKIRLSSLRQQCPIFQTAQTIWVGAAEKLLICRVFNCGYTTASTGLHPNLWTIIDVGRDEIWGKSSVSTEAPYSLCLKAAETHWR